MILMNIGIHHFLRKYKYFNEDLIIENKRFRVFINQSVYIVGILGILVIIPQILEIWVNKNSASVSLLTWVGFLIASSFWLFYGLIHKAKPIIFVNIAAIIANLLVVTGLILFK